MIQSFLTARDQAVRMAPQAPLASTTGGTDLPVVFVNSQRRFQTIEGFGGAFTEAAAVTWQALDAARQADLLRDYFDWEDGHGYSLCRVHMNSCDFAIGSHAHAGLPGDAELHHFNIDRDRQALLPFIRAAQDVAGRPLKLLMSPSSPPAWMKSGQQRQQGGTLLPEYRHAWARCYVRFIEEYARQGVPVWAVTVQNESATAQRRDACVYSAEEERDFVRDHLGPELERAGLEHIKIVIWDHNRDYMVERASVVLSDPGAARYVWGTGFHWYGEQHFDHMQLLHDAWPDKHLLFTEGCQEGGPHTGSWDLGERHARSMINDFNRWTVGWIDWNLLLNEAGGPDHAGNLYSAPILADSDSTALLHQSSFFYIGHFARFIKPGARRVLCAATRENLEATAFRNPDGWLVTVVMNRTEETQHFALRPDGRNVVTSLPPRSIATYLSAPVRTGN